MRMDLKEIAVVSRVFGPERSSAPCSLPHKPLTINSSPVLNNLTSFNALDGSTGFNSFTRFTDSNGLNRPER